MLCVEILIPLRKHCTSVFITIICLVLNRAVEAQETDYIQATVHVQNVETELDVEGSLRETRFTSIDFSLREQLAETVDGALLLGYLDVRQKTNPVLAGQNTAGGYIGIDLRWHLLNRERFKMQTTLDYRYVNTDASIDDQKVEWRWHQIDIGLHTQTYISNSLFLILGASATNIDGVEKSRGPLNQDLDFTSNDSLTGHIGLQLATWHTGEISVILRIGSSQGGRISFQRSF